MTRERELSVNEFRNDLKELLDKYKAHICFDFDEWRDTHGMYGEKVVISNQDTVFIEIDGYSIYSSDIKLKKMNND